MHIIRAGLLDGLCPHQVAGLIIGGLGLVSVEHITVLLYTRTIAGNKNLLFAPGLRRIDIRRLLGFIAIIDIGGVRRAVVAIDVKTIFCHDIGPLNGVPLQQPESIKAVAIGGLAKLGMR